MLPFDAKVAEKFLNGIEGRPLASVHGPQTPNEGINQRYLKNWADVADKICFERT